MAPPNRLCRHAIRGQGQDGLSGAPPAIPERLQLARPHGPSPAASLQGLFEVRDDVLLAPGKRQPRHENPRPVPLPRLLSWIRPLRLPRRLELLRPLQFFLQNVRQAEGTVEDPVGRQNGSVLAGVADVAGLDGLGNAGVGDVGASVGGVEIFGVGGHGVGGGRRRRGGVAPICVVGRGVVGNGVVGRATVVADRLLSFGLPLLPVGLPSFFFGGLAGVASSLLLSLLLFSLSVEEQFSQLPFFRFLLLPS
mmetsp:Transcript_26714/g.61471  ORF Transcript_26714/g.61471 Transcript_26714/m.61471 type:complete len:251 (-) Transcript_26714:235-987(-)